jgi:translocation and assembly module TamB
MSTHLERASTALPPPPRRSRRRDWGRSVARLVCVLFALTGLLPVAVTFLARSAFVRGWVTRETSRVLREQGVNATYEVAVRLWPLSLELSHVTVASTDGGAPALTCDRVAARPKFFALLAGEVVVQQIEADDPHIRLVVRGKRLENLGLDLASRNAEPKKGPFHAPFGVVAVTDLDLDLDLDGALLSAHEVDADVTVDDDRERGSSFEIGVRAGQASLRRERDVFPNGADKPAVRARDDDVLCAVDARVRLEPALLIVRRLEAEGSADLDLVSDALPRCNLPQDDKRRVDLALSHLRVRFPEKPGELPLIDGHVKARAPLGLVERLASFPSTNGWVAVDADVRYALDTQIPDFSGHFEAHDVALDQYDFAHEIQADLQVRRNVVTSPSLMLRIAGGVATISDITVEPLAKGVPMKAKLDVRDASFVELMKDLGVSQHAHVGWDLKEVHVPRMAGTLVPLKLDGELNARTPNFIVADAALDDPAHARVIGIKEASLQTHVAIRPEALEFHNVYVQTRNSRIEGGLVSIGFHNDLIVDVPKGSVDLEDIGPLATIPIRGVAELAAKVHGRFNDPKLEADTQIKGFVLGDIPFGDVTAAHVMLNGLVVDLAQVKAQKGRSAYEMPTARLDFGRHAGLHMDAIAASSALGMRDFLAIWKMDDDPRFAEIDGSIATRATVHVSLGGPEDVCGTGYFDIRATAHVKDVRLFGEAFDDGDLDLDYRWTDRAAGVEGADVDIRGFTLHKVHRRGASPIGAVLGSGTLARGGELRASVLVDAVPLSRIDSLGAYKGEVEGAASGVAEVSGRIDAYRVDADVDVTPVRARGVSFGSSRLRVGLTQRPPDGKPTGRTRCGGRVFPPFNKEAYLRDTSSQGEWTLSGDLLGGQIALQSFSMSREKAPLVRARAGLRALDLGALAKMNAAPPDPDAPPAAPGSALSGGLSGDLLVERLKLDELATTRARFVPAALSLERGGQKLVLRPAPVNFVVEQDTLVVPPLVFDLNAKNGLKGSFIVRGQVDRLTRGASLALTAELLPVDLGLLAGVVPKIERASGTLSGLLRIGGTAASPALDGAAQLRGGEIAARGLPGVIRELDVDVRADTSEIRIARASAKFLGGTVAVTRGRIPLKDFAFNVADGLVTVRGVNVAPADGVSAVLDADLAVSYNGQAAGLGQQATTARLPHVTGDVLVTSFEYTRPINLLTDLGGLRPLGARRTNVETYDPTLDAVTLDVRVRSRAPLRLKNNLVEAQLAIDSGVLGVTGTNQRIGLRGDLKALPGGRFHLFANDFDVRQAIIRFEDPTRISPVVDIVAVTEYRRYSDTSAGAAAGASSYAGAAAATGSGRGLWRITLHAYGDADNVRLEMTSDPALAQEDIFFLLTVGLTRSEVDQVQAGSLGASVAFQAVGTASGADRALKAAIPVIDDFRFGSAYSSRTGRSEPQVTVGRRVTDNVRASVTTGLTEDRELRSNIEWRLNQKLSVQATYDNINDVSSSAIGNVGGGFRWRMEFE